MNKNEVLSFKTAFQYPFNRAIGLWNILWCLIPILGMFALFGYGIRLAQEFIRGEFKQLPTFRFWENCKLGFLMFLKMIPFLFVYVLFIGALESLLHKSPFVLFFINLFLGILVLPILIINFFNKETVKSSFELKIVKSVFDNLGDYLMAFLKSIGLGVVFILMWIVLVGIPAGSFTKNIFLADFYRRRVL